MDIQIRKNVPLPKTPSNKGRGKWQILFSKMEKGDSFNAGEFSLPMQRSILIFAKNNGISITTRKIDGHLFVWRIE